MMIKVFDIEVGWLTLEINGFRFCVSYLDDFKMCMDYLLGIGKDNEYTYHWNIEARSITLDGEGTELKLSITKHIYEDDFLLNWWVDDGTPVSKVFNYGEFVRQYKQVMDDIGEEVYRRDFLMESEDEDE